MIIRHGEKPPDAPPPYAVQLDGEKNPEALIVRGWQRAGALVPFFAPSDGHFSEAHITTPQTIYASKVEKDSKAWRHQQTVTPLLDRLGMDAVACFDFPKDQVAPMMQDVLSRSGVVLICWDHNSIPKIAQQLSLSADSAIPGEWSDERFDLVWVFDLVAGTNTYRFTQVLQRLLAGDLS